jgi:hypothetical protein
MKIRHSLVTLATGVAVAIAISGTAVTTHFATSAGSGGAKLTHSTVVRASTDGQDPWPKP